ncbi:uncharacterized protein K452DRAFT_343328 [Aplosporella prunicola CBS 121167]|uniref:Uncharacterized protein n=1 Tax=Aplosporella prunicola CBS 121167 TaxID=1176127 RepID=A0A6A6BQI9_9PEZI|nr:uncharacterized protein K452DRAFT_343328 [Aplosporella prunicola CBS 121167]KAF2144851.1 hypothetical protein K452DRAFT_343328 [Aplosporella prunicola CBS 121167]
MSVNAPATVCVCLADHPHISRYVDASQAQPSTQSHEPGSVNCKRRPRHPLSKQSRDYRTIGTIPHGRHRASIPLCCAADQHITRNDAMQGFCRSVKDPVTRPPPCVDPRADIIKRASVPPMRIAIELPIAGVAPCRTRTFGIFALPPLMYWGCRDFLARRAGVRRSECVY